MYIDLKKLGLRCKFFRVEAGYKQSDVARDTGYTPETISSFETGRNDNLRIFMWYVDHGFPLDKVKEAYVNG